MPSTVQYGVVSMEMIKTTVLEYKAHFDLRKTYLFTRVKIEFQCILNPARNSYFMDATGAVFAGGANEGPAIAKAIRHYLAQPRRQLIITHGNTEVLRSPLNGVPCDCTSGPTRSRESSSDRGSGGEESLGKIRGADGHQRVSRE